MIKCDNICYAYDKEPALRYVSFEVQKGECVILQGPNGCGKSTLFKILNGLLFPEEGTYTFDGQPISAKTMADPLFAKKFHQRLGFIFQNADVQLFCSNVKEELEFGPKQMGLSAEEIDRRVTDVVSMLSLQKLLQRAPYHLSGGEKRKVAIACILTMNPDALILDEPLAGLDRGTQLWLSSFLLSLKKAGKTLLIATHDDALARNLGDRILEMDENHTIR